MSRKVWDRGLCQRPDCQECADARRGCIWNPYKCEVTRDENRNRPVGEVLGETLAELRAVLATSPTERKG